MQARTFRFDQQSVSIFGPPLFPAAIIIAEGGGAFSHEASLFEAEVSCSGPRMAGR
jgi:hypothetical protein